MAQRRGFGLGLSAERGALCSLSRCLHFSIASVPTTNHPNREIERKNDAESTSLPTDILLCSGSNRGEPLRSFHSRESTSDSDRPILSVGFSPPELYLFKSVELASSLYFSEWYGIYFAFDFPWLFHVQHGWQYVFPVRIGEVFLYDLESEDFWWTTCNFQPFTFYSFSRKAFIFYFQGTSQTREFVNLETGEFFTRPSPFAVVPSNEYTAKSYRRSAVPGRSE